MVAYAKLDRFYDGAMGDQTEMGACLRRLIRQHKAGARTLLELACGTGAILKILAKSYEVAGLDVSPQMLSLARKKLPHVRFYRKDMVSFELATKFDVIICVFDSINHVLNFTDWQKIFRNAARHLEKDGLFLFDINTEAKLERLINAPTWVHKFGRNLEFINVTDGRRGIANWNIRGFEHRRGNKYGLFEEDIKEIFFPVNKIRAALRKEFTNIKIIDPAERTSSTKSDRLYFVCKR